jgi:hypothetical protein
VAGDVSSFLLPGAPISSNRGLVASPCEIVGVEASEEDPNAKAAAQAEVRDKYSKRLRICTTSTPLTLGRNLLRRIT